MTAYYAPRIYRNAHINTIAAASMLRKLYATNISKTFRKQSQEVILNLNQGVQLQGFLNKTAPNAPLAMIIHGWLGCADSLYQLPLATRLNQKGLNVFRLNLRDHGSTHHLNKELFHSCRLEEVLNATYSIQQQIPHSNFYLIGFSLGGNFALRIGAKAQNKNLNIKKIFSICPVMDPENALKETQSMLKIYTEYYLRRWKSMLQKKHQFFPNDYDLDTIKQQRTLTDMTEHLLLRYTEFNSLKDYLNGYSVTGEKLKTLSVPSEVFLSEDDPVIPVNDKKKLYPSKYLNIHLTEHGGHCGYLNGLFKMNWTDEQIMEQLNVEYSCAQI